MDAQPLNLARPEVPVELAALVAKMMAKEPERRFQQPAEVAKALAPFFKRAAVTAETSDLRTPPETEPAAATQTQRRGPRWFWPAFASLVGSVAILFGAVVTYRIATDNGQLVIEAEDPNIEVVVKQGGKKIIIIDPHTKKQVELRSGRYELELPVISRD